MQSMRELPHVMQTSDSIATQQVDILSGELNQDKEREVPRKAAGILFFASVGVKGEFFSENMSRTF